MSGASAPPAPPGAGFRDYGDAAPPRVHALYRENHARQTLDFVRQKHAEYLPLRRRRLGVWEALEALDEIVDQSDPDLELGQLDHALQTAESLREAGEPPWLVLAGLVHDLGKVLCLFGEPQWAVVGDTFPVGCAFSDRIVLAELFAANPDASHPVYATPLGIYEAGCGLDALTLSWGHDEYLYRVLRPHLPPPALDVVRFHSFYALHQEGAYRELLAPGDDERVDCLRRFQRHDLYSKHEEPPQRARVLPYYEALVREHLPPVLQW